MPGDFERRFSGEVDVEESNDSSVNDLGKRSIPSSWTVMAGSCTGDCEPIAADAELSIEEGDLLCDDGEEVGIGVDAVLELLGFATCW